MKNRALTLIELLVSLSILALLAAILVPVIASARESADGIACAAALKQIGAGHVAFQNDHRSYYPEPGGVITWDDPTQESWMEQLDDYLTDTPGRRDDRLPIYAGCPSYPQRNALHYFMAANAAYIEAGNRMAALRGDSLLHPSAYVLGGDNNLDSPAEDADKDDATFNRLGLPGVDPASGGAQIGSGDYWTPQHFNELNVLFADGRIARVEEFDPATMTFAIDTMDAWRQP
ncbi:MAG: type II secretion system protein [Planctomycetota bacterium]